MTRSKLYRDVTWCINSPPLAIQDTDTWPENRWFEQLSVPDFEVIDPGPNKLGFRFEQFIKQWIDHHPDLALVAANVQIFDDKRTIGELDLLVTNGGELEHWEVAIKFYLGTGDGLDTTSWHGPNPEDTLAKKVDRLSTHQLLLTEHPATRQLLADNNWQPRKVRCFLKGRLFYPLDGSIVESPAGANPNHLKGWWQTADDFCNQARDTHYLLLEKSDWMSTIITDVTDLLSHTELIEQLQSFESRGSCHIAVIDASGYEVSRGFIVFPKWLANLQAQRTS